MYGTQFFKMLVTSTKIVIKDSEWYFRREEKETRNSNDMRNGILISKILLYLFDNILYYFLLSLKKIYNYFNPIK